MNQTHKLHLPYLYQTAHASVKNNPLTPHLFFKTYWSSGFIRRDRSLVRRGDGLGACPKLVEGTPPLPRRNGIGGVLGGTIHIPLQNLPIFL